MKRQNGWIKNQLMFVSVIVGLLVPYQAFAYSVSVGYADNLRPSAFFPSPFYGDPGVAFFNGQDPNVFALDAGAVMITNDGVSNIVVDDLTVTLAPGSSPLVIDLWGNVNETLAPGQSAIFTQTAQYNFDTSDYRILVGSDISNNCSVGALSTTANCTTNAPLVSFTVDGVVANLSDTGHVLDTGGFDAVCCLPDGNESLQWRLIGGSGVQNPGGGAAVPEPSSILLLGLGALGLGLWRRNQAGLKKDLIS